MDITKTQVIVFILERLGFKKYMIELAKDRDCHNVIESYIRYKATSIKDTTLINFIEYFL